MEDGFVAVMVADELMGAGLRMAEVDGAVVLLSRSETGEACAISSLCAHAGGPLAEGERMGDTVICPWHGSEFDLCSGEVKHGPAQEPVRRFEVRIRNGMLEIRPV